jgi:hypothetical protein
VGAAAAAAFRLLLGACAPAACTSTSAAAKAVPRRCAAGSPATRQVLLERCGHLPMEELPARCAQELAGFAVEQVPWGAAAAAGAPRPAAVGSAAGPAR